jgi:hypothetical protein
MMTRRILVTLLGGVTLSLIASGTVLASKDVTNAKQMTKSSSQASNIVLADKSDSKDKGDSKDKSEKDDGSEMEGCGNSGKPGCPPKKCPDGHGGTNPAGHEDCKNQKSGD